MIFLTKNQKMNFLEERINELEKINDKLNEKYITTLVQNYWKDKKIEELKKEIRQLNKSLRKIKCKEEKQEDKPIEKNYYEEVEKTTPYQWR